MKYLYLFLLLFIFQSCFYNKNKNEITNTEKQDLFVLPSPIKIKQSKITHLKNCPNPKIINIKSPSTVEGDFLSQMQKYTTDNGLALDAIACAILDMKGNLWFGTYGGGVSKYDGYEFTNFNIAHGLTNNFVCSILEDRKGNLWFGSSGGGVSKYNGSSIKNYTSKDGLANDIIRSIFEDKKGNIWFGTQGGGVSIFNGEKFKNYSTKHGLSNNIIRGISEDFNGNIWLGTDGGGVSKWDGKKFSSFSEKNGLAFNNIRCVFTDRLGRIWFGSQGGGVSIFDGKKIKNLTTENGLIDNQISCISEDKKGNIWIGSQDKGVSCYDGKSFQNFTQKQGLINNFVRSITQDKTGNIWFGTQGGGVCRYDGKSFFNYTTEQGLSNNIIITTCQDNKNNLWYGTYGNGALCFNGKQFTNFTTAQGLGNDIVFSITKDKKGNLWFGTNGGGVSKYDGKSFTNYTTDQGLANNVVLSSIEDSKGNLWFGTLGGGVSKFDGKSFTNYTSKNGLAFDVIMCLKEDSKGNIWIGTNGGGLSKYYNETFTNYTIKHGLSNNIILCVTEDKYKNLWFGTDGDGVSRFDGKDFLNFSKTQGLPDNTVTQVVIDNDQNILLGTNLGVAVAYGFKNKISESRKNKIKFQNSLKNSELKKYKPEIKIFNSKNGYPVKDVNAGQNAMFKDSKGIFWIATGSDQTGLVRFNYSELNHDKKRPFLQINNIKINNENICWHDLNYSKKTEINDTVENSVTQPNVIEEIIRIGRILSKDERDTMRLKFSHLEFSEISRFNSIPENLVLPFKHGNITFEFNAIEPSKPYLINYQYKLEGYDDNWSPVSTNTIASFGNIYEGEYIFKVKAQSQNGVWSYPITYKFKVSPPWWRTWWMYLIYIISAIGSIFLIVWFNSRRLRANAIELKKQIDNATSTISEQKIIVEKKNRDITDSINYALRIQQAFLPKKEAILKSFPKSFILFKPKDIVSGDFYFYHKNEDHLIIAAVDCTGHGVPGAFMSMIGSERLTDSVLQSSITNEILSLLNKGVKKSLHQNDNEESTRDGMDIAICSFNHETNKITYSGANRPFWLIRKGANNIEEIKATKVAIGGLTKNEQEFEEHEIQLFEGDTFYIFTDGYGDLFNNEGKKLKTKKLKEILIKIQNLSMPEQEVYLDDFAEKWKSGSEQIDDILIIGIRI